MQLSYNVALTSSPSIVCSSCSISGTKKIMLIYYVKDIFMKDHKNFSNDLYQQIKHDNLIYLYHFQLNALLNVHKIPVSVAPTPVRFKAYQPAVITFLKTCPETMKHTST